MAKKTWHEKLHGAKYLPKFEPIPESLQNQFGVGTMVIAKPLDVKEIMDRVPFGKIITINMIRAELAQKYEVTTACPVTTGIFAWIVAHAAEVDKIAGKENVTPYWRTLKTKYELNPKYPGGLQAQIDALEAEGHNIIIKRDKAFIQQ